MELMRSLRATENFHIVLWLMKDLFWVMDLKVPGTVMVMPTLAMALWIAWRCRHDTGELLHSLAVVCWITANGTWMVGEFFFADTKRHVAIPFFIAGLLLVAWYYLVMMPRRARRQGA